MNKKLSWLLGLLTIGVAVVSILLLIQLLGEGTHPGLYEKDQRIAKETKTLYGGTPRSPNISREGHDKTQADILAVYESKPPQKAQEPLTGKPKKASEQMNSVEPEQPSPTKVNVISTPPKEEIYLPSTISVNHPFSFPTMKVIMVFFGGLILCSVVGFVVGIIFAKKFFGDWEKLETRDIRGWEYRQNENLLNLLRRIDRDMIRRDDISEIRKNIQVVLSETREIKDFLAKMGTSLPVKDYIPEERVSQGTRQTPSSVKPPRTLAELRKAYNDVNAQNKDEIDRFLSHWNCNMFEMKYSTQLGTVSFVEKEMGDFFSVDIRNSTYILPHFFSPFDPDRRLILRKCYEIEGIDRIGIGDKYSLIEPATVSIMPDRCPRLLNKGKIEVLKAPIGEQETEEQKDKSSKLELPDKELITDTIETPVKTEPVLEDEISEARVRRQIRPEEEMKFTPMEKRRTIKELLDHYNRVDFQNRAGIEQFLRDWRCERVKMHHSFMLNRVSFSKAPGGHFMLVEIGNRIHLFPFFYPLPSHVALKKSLGKCYEMPGAFLTAAKYSVTESAIVSRLPDGSFRLEKKGKVNIIKTPAGMQETKAQRGEPFTGLKKIDIDEIAREYNRTLVNEALRPGFLKLYPWKNLSMGFQNISFHVTKNYYWVFPSFDHIVSGHRVPEVMRKLFDAPPGFIRSVEEIARIKPAKLKLPNLIEERGKIIIKG